MTNPNQTALEAAMNAQPFNSELTVRTMLEQGGAGYATLEAAVRAYLDALPAAPLPEEVERVVAEWTAAMDGVTPGPWTADQSHSQRYLDAVQFSYQSGSKGTVALVGKDEAQVGASETEEQNANSGWIARCSPDGIRSLLALITQQAQALADANARIRAMEEALEPFASCCDAIEGGYPERREWGDNIAAYSGLRAPTMGELRRARRARGGNNAD